MNEIKFNIIEKDEYTVVQFELSGPIFPEILKSLDPLKADPKKGGGA